MRLIDSQVAIEHLKKRLYETEFNSSAEYPYYQEIADNRVDVWMNEVPIAQQEIVRCKDCKHRDTEDRKCDCGHDIMWQLPRQDEWYCADAERRTDDAPTIEPEIVRCKDCKHGVDYYHEGDCYCSNPKWGLRYFGGSWEFYCADAERI